MTKAVRHSLTYRKYEDLHGLRVWVRGVMNTSIVGSSEPSFCTLVALRTAGFYGEVGNEVSWGWLNRGVTVTYKKRGDENRPFLLLLPAADPADPGSTDAACISAQVGCCRD